MADNNENRSIFDNIETIASTAGIVGFAAAVLNRNGNMLSTGLNRSAGALAKSFDKIRRSGKNFNYSTLKSAASVFKESYDNYDDIISFSGLKSGMAELYSNLLSVNRHATTLAQDTIIKHATIGLQNRFTKDVSSELAERRAIAINSFLRTGIKDISPNTVDAYRDIRKLSDRTLGISGLKFTDSDIAFINDELINLNQIFRGGSGYNGNLDEVKNLFGKDSNPQSFMSSMIAQIEEDLRKGLLNIDDAEKKFGSKTSPTNIQSFLNPILGDSPATLGEVYEYFDKNKNSFSGSQYDQAQKFLLTFDGLINDKNVGERWSNLYFSNDLRIDSGGQFHQFSALEDALKTANEFYNETIVAKVLKTKELFGNKQRLFSFAESGSVNPFIEKTVTGVDTVLSNNAYVSIYDKLYKVGNSGLEYLEGFDGVFKTIDKTGIAAEGIKRMYGTDYQTYNSRTFLDFNESYKMNPLESAKSFFSKFNDPRYGRNVANAVLKNNSDSIQDAINKKDVDESFDLFGTYSDFVSVLNKSNNALDRDIADRLSGIFKTRDTDNSNTVAEILNILSMSDNDMTKSFMSFDTDKLRNSGDLRRQLMFMKKDPYKYLNTYRTESDYMVNGINKRFSAYDMLRQSATEEVMDRLSSEYGEDAIYEILSSIGGKESKKALRSYYSSRVSDIYKSSISFRATENATKDDIAQQAINAADVLNRYLGDNQRAQESLRDLVNDNISLLQTGFNNKEYYSSQYSNNIYVKRGINPLEILRNLNDKEKAKSSAGNFAKQFFAGTSSTDNITEATFGPFFFVNRLTKDFDRFGFGFSNDAYSSTLNLAKNIMLKRALPIAGAIIGLSYLNFESDKLTGSSLSESLLSGIANIDLGIRKITDITGTTNALKAASVSNPIISYWMNEEEYQGYDERKGWYESGYSPVRSGRFWSFGSASEFRGGKISYFQPSYLRRASSNYYDVSVYGSSEEKWKHSWIPTPRYPLSTLNALLDPYWLEKKHYEDRPYPVTGKMFDEGTPWGVILNPTIGEILKPQRKMHQYELQGTTVDVRALIRKYNEQEKAKSNGQYISIGTSGGVSMVTPIDGSYQPGQSPDYNVYYDGSNTAYYAPYNERDNNQYISNNIGGVRVSDLNVADRIQIASSTNPIAFAASRMLPLSMISGVNESIKQRALQNVRSGYDSENFSPYTGPIYSDSRQYDPTAENFDRDTFLDTRSIEEWLTDASYSAKELSGIYGFAFDMIFPPKQKYADAHAGEMVSFSSRFWDESVGGFGGDIMEIARRFFPHEDHSVTKINNLRNTMPEWIPERYRYGR